jgi:hypothetical protein
MRGRLQQVRDVAEGVGGKRGRQQQPRGAATGRDRRAGRHDQQQQHVADRVGEVDGRPERRPVSGVSDRCEHHRGADRRGAEAGDRAVEHVLRGETATLEPR